jgi:predicted TIM-barrel fold metal-dependent hydrolase
MVASGRPIPALVDSNSVLGKWAVGTPGSPNDVDDHTQMLRAFGIDRALVVHAEAVWVECSQGNRKLLQLTAGQPHLIPSWVLAPGFAGETADSEVSDLMRNSDVRAARMYPTLHRFAFRMSEAASVLSSLAESRVPLWVDFGQEHWADDRIDWEGLREVATALPDLPIVVVGVSISSSRRLQPLLERCANVHVETSYFVMHRGIELLCETFGPTRVLFGSNFPARHPGPAITALSYSIVDEETRDLVGSGNLLRLIAEAHP